MDRILIDGAALGQSVGVFLLPWGNERVALEEKREGKTDLHDLEVLYILAFCLDQLPDDIIAGSLLGVRGYGYDWSVWC